MPLGIVKILRDLSGVCIQYSADAALGIVQILVGTVEGHDIYTRAVSQQKREANAKVVEMLLPGAPKMLQHPSAPSTQLEAVG